MPPERESTVISPILALPCDFLKALTSSCMGGIFSARVERRSAALTALLVLNALVTAGTSFCWPWSTLEKACLKRAMALHRDSGRSEAACAKAELCSRISWQHGTL